MIRLTVLGVRIGAILDNPPWILGPGTVSTHALVRRMLYGGRKGCSALRRLRRMGLA